MGVAMQASRVVRTFPSVRLPSLSGGLPVEVALIAQLGHGSGTQLVETARARQRGHASFVDALDEPSARLGDVDFAHDDATSLYSFAVGSGGHPFHRHAGHRVFTAISGSAGTQLRFSSASPQQIERDPRSFIDALRLVDIPPDCLFTVRFGGGTWHQFVPLRRGTHHPALFALSCHTNELGGDLPLPVRQRVLEGSADIPTLTELLPDAVVAAMNGPAFDIATVPTVALSLDARPSSWLAKMCAFTRSTLGRLRGAWSRWLSPTGFLAGDDSAVKADPRGRFAALGQPAADSLLRNQFADRFDHEDCFELVVESGAVESTSARVLMASLLKGFLSNRPTGVSRLMGLRNRLVRPLGLRTSPLGCPVSSLLAPQSDAWFAGRYPVLAQRVDAFDIDAQVVLGADDKHLAFRSCVGVRRLSDGRVAFSLGTRVRHRNVFGAIYMGLIDRVHRSYVSPAMLHHAVEHLLRSKAR